MAYIPVPSVAAGDWIDEIFINTYWRDNMAASVPDVFSAKGQLAVATGVDALGVLNVGADGLILTAKAAATHGVSWEEINAVYQRKGGSSTAWNTQGSTNYTPANARIMIGVGRITFTAQIPSSVQITYPTAFAYAPVVFVTSKAGGVPPGSLNRLYIGNEFASSFYAFAELSASSTGTLDFTWLAIGPSA